MKYALVFWSVTLLCIYYAVAGRGWMYILCWPGLSFGVAGAAYVGGGPRYFGKRQDGSLNPVALLLLLPYLLYTWGVWYLWRLTTSEPPFHNLYEGVKIGRRLLPPELPDQTDMVFDLTSEFPEPSSIRSSVLYRLVPALDARPPEPVTLREAAEQVLSAKNAVYIHCANGHGRTGTLAGAVLMLSGKTQTTEETIAFIRRCRPGVTLNSSQRKALDDFSRTIITKPANERSSSE